MKYFLGTDSVELLLIKYDEDTCQRYDLKKQDWVSDFKATQLFGKMCLGSIDAEEISKSAAEKKIKESQ